MASLIQFGIKSSSDALFSCFCLSQPISDVRIAEKLRSGADRNAFNLRSEDGRRILVAEEHEEAGTEDVVVVVHDELCFEFFGFSGEFLHFLSEFAVNAFRALTGAHHAHGLLLNLPHFVFDAVVFPEELVEFFIERSAGDSLSGVVHLNVEIPVFNDDGHDALVLGEHHDHHGGIHVADEVETSVNDFAGVNANRGGFKLLGNPLGGDAQIEHSAVQARHGGVACNVVLFCTRGAQQQNGGEDGSQFVHEKNGRTFFGNVLYFHDKYTVSLLKPPQRVTKTDCEINLFWDLVRSQTKNIRCFHTKVDFFHLSFARATCFSATGVFLFLFTVDSEDGINFQHGGNEERHFPFGGAEGRYAEVLGEHETRCDEQEHGSEHLLAAQTSDDEVRAFVGIVDLQRTEEQCARRENEGRHFGSEEGHHGSEREKDASETEEELFHTLQQLFHHIDVLVGVFHVEVHSRHALNGFLRIFQRVEFLGGFFILFLIHLDFFPQLHVLQVEFIAMPITVGVEEAHDENEDDDAPEIFLTEKSQSELF